MSRLTGNDAMGLMEAYASVYEPQELNEEQIQEDFELWVNDLLEEGYDLSDYTWNEMYDLYEDEYGRIGYALGRGVRNLAGKAVRGAVDVVGAGYQGYAGTPTTSKNPAARAINAATRTTTAAVRGGIRFGQGLAGAPNPNPKGNTPAPAKPKPSFDGKQDFKNKGGFAGMAQRSSDPNQRMFLNVLSTTAGGKGNRPGAGAGAGGGAGGGRSLGAGAGAGAGAGGGRSLGAGAGGRPAPVPAAPRPAATTSRPPVPSAKPTPTPTPSTTSAPQKSTFNPLMQRTFGYQTGNAPDQRAKAPEVTQTSKIAASPRPLPVQPLGGARQRVLNQSYEYMEPFDLVLEYLVSEGHADTLDEALYVMMEMDSETIQSICEEYMNEGFKPTGYHDDYDPYTANNRRQSRTTSSRGRRIQNRVQSLEKQGDTETADFIHKTASNRTNHERGLATQRRNARRGPGPRRARNDAMNDMRNSGFAD